MSALSPTIATPRPRTHRRPTGKLVKINDRALDIFDRLDRNVLLPTNYLHAFLGGNLTNLSNRLGDLYHENNTPPYFGWYLERPEGQWRTMNARYVPATHTNLPLAERALRDNGRPVRQKANFSNSFFHDLMACILGAAFELSARADPAVTHLSWEDIRDHERTPAKTRELPSPFNIPLRGRDLRPDDRPFGYRYTRPDGKTRSILFAGIEADRRTEPLTAAKLRHSSMAQKFEDYREFIDRGVYMTHFGFPFTPLVPIVTVSEARMRNMMMLLSDICGRATTKYFLFRAIPEFASFEHAIPITDDFLTAPWQRAQHDPVTLLEVLTRQ